MAATYWNREFSAAAVLGLAPDALAAFAVVFGAVPNAADVDLLELLELVRHRVATLLATPIDCLPTISSTTAAKLDHLAAWPTSSEFSDRDRAGLAFAEQFVMDVSGLSVADRAALTAAFGSASFGFVQTVYVLDHGSRLAAVLRQLFGVNLFADSTVANGAELWPSLEAMMAAVVRLKSLDPLTAELIRLRGARAHDCRVCSSRRRVSAVVANAALLEARNPSDRVDVTDHQRAALALTDAIVGNPADLGAEVRQLVHENLSPPQAVEVALLVAHNAANKIAVALGADAPAVSEGVEFFELSDTGEYAYGLPAPG